MQKDNSKANFTSGTDKEINPDNNRYRVIGLDSSCSSSCNFSELDSSVCSGCMSDTSSPEESGLDCSSCSSNTNPSERRASASFEDLSFTDESSPEESEELDESLSCEDI